MTTLTEKIVHEMETTIDQEDWHSFEDIATAIVAVVRAHLTDEDTVERAARAHFMSHYASPDIYPLLSEPAKDMWKSDCRAALAAALDQEEQK